MKEIIIYTTPTCPYCKMAKEFFTQNRIAYQEKNVMADPRAREEMVEKSGQLGVPVIDVDGRIVIGFDRPALSDLLNLR